jgi:hypothetical protein
MGENLSGPVATFAPNRETWAGEKGDTAEALVSMGWW